MNRPANKNKPEPCLSVIKVYCDDEDRATLESHCHAEGMSLSGYLRREGLRTAVAHQQIKRSQVQKQGPVAGLRRAFAFPGVRRASRSALRPMRS
jgi:hypothetical protein